MDDKHKSRRSSILKPPKPRNPLSDVDLNPHPPSTSTDATFLKSRRVSFANSNFIKEFTADPEKNTIWHNSYEEEINKSEDSKSIEQQAVTDTINISTFEDDDVFNCTKAEIFDNSFETARVNSPLETSVCSANIDLTNPVFNLNDPETREGELGDITLQRDRNICVLFDQNAFANTMEITGSIPANSNLMKNILKCKHQQQQFQLDLGVMNKENEPYYNDNDDEMELTRAAAHSNSCRNLDLKQHVIPVIVVVDEENSIENIESVSVDAEDCSMEITQTVPTSITTTTDVFAIASTSARDMEITGVLPGGIQWPQAISDSDNMDFTQAIPTSIHATNNDYMEMEFTQTIPSAIKLVTSDCYKRIHEKNDNMEFTQPIPAIINLINNMEFTDADALNYKDEEYKLEHTELTAENNADKSDMVNSADNEKLNKSEAALTLGHLILSPDPSTITTNGNDCDANKSDICLRIKHPGNDAEPDAAASTSTLNVFEMEVNCSKELSCVDSTEKLINYQIELNCDQSLNKKCSSENICSSGKKASEISSANINQDENVAWQSMVEKSFINNDILSSENVSLVNSFDVDTGNDLKIEEPEIKMKKKTISDYLQDYIDRMEDALKMAENILKVPYIVKDDDKLECAGAGVSLRKRFEESFKAQEHELSLEEKIKEKSEGAVWNLVESNGLVYTFDFIFETIVFDVHVAETSENVQKIEFYSQFDESDAEPTIILAHNMLKKKLTKNYISSALGQPYDVLSLLDLITIMSEQMVDALDELNELALRYCLVIDDDLKAQIQFLDLQLPIGFEVTINTNNLEHITSDDVNVNVLAGEIDGNAIKKLVHGCPPGIHFLRKFILNVEGYIDLLKYIQ